MLSMVSCGPGAITVHESKIRIRFHDGALLPIGTKGRKSIPLYEVGLHFVGQ